jgi:hypothetical protein
MKFHVYQKEELVGDYEVDLFDDETDEEKAFSKFRKMWRDMVNLRDKMDCPPRFKIQGEIDSKVQNAIALGMNIGKFGETIALFCNAFIPRAVGAAALKSIFDDNCLTWPKCNQQLTERGEMQPYLPSSNGIYSFHFYEPLEWAHYSMSSIANASGYVPFDVQDYGMLCRAVRQCPKGARPMVWINPHLAKAFIEVNESEITPVMVQTYISSFVIVSALTNEEVDDDMVDQLWAALEGFLDMEDENQMVELYHAAETALSQR